MNSIKKNFFYNSIYQVLNMFIPLITTPYLSRILGAEGLGVYSYHYAIANYFSIFIMLGVTNYGNREIAKNRDEKIRLTETFWEIYFTQFVLGLIIVFIYLAYCYFIIENKITAYIMTIYLFSTTFDVGWCCFGLENFKLISIRNSIIKLLTTLSIFAFIKKKEDVLLYCIIMVVGMLVSQLTIWPYVIKKVGFCVPDVKNILKHIKPNCFLFMTTLAVSLFKIMDKIMLGAIATTDQVGFYEASEKITSLPTAFIVALGTVMLPRMTNIKVNSSNESGKYIYKSIILAMFLASAISFGIMSVSDIFVPIFYGEGYEICSLLYKFLLPSCLFFAFANVIRTQFLLPNEMDKVYVISAVCGAGVNLVINLVLIPVMGAVGAALGTFFAEMVVCFYQVYNVRKMLPINRYIRCSALFVAAGMIMYVGVQVFIRRFAVYNNYLKLMLSVVLGVFLYFLTFWMLNGFSLKNIKNLIGDQI